MSKYRTLDVQHQDMIRAYLQELSIITGRKPNRTEEYGHGPLKWAAESVLKWADEQSYVFYNPRKVPLNAKLLSIRIRQAYSGASLMNGIHRDALWIANQMRMHTGDVVKPKSEPRQLTLTNTVPDPPHLVTPTPTDAKIDDVINAAHALRKLSTTGDVDLWAIISEAELEVLRLLVVRLEK